MTFTTTWLTVVAALILAAAPSGARNAAPGAAPGPGPATHSASGPPTGCAGPPGPSARCWPVAGPGARGRPQVLRGFEPPPTPWAAGHRGVDLRAGPGSPVRAPAPGEVAFTGTVGGIPVIVLRLPGGLRTTYEPARATPAVGTKVAAGQQLGRTVSGGLPHCPGLCLHWGLLRGDTYLDPLSLLPPTLLRSDPSRLLPVDGVSAMDG
jgi:murein DD-endopeptidase MepM/ murein hydrolase activator NlpD